jgi:glycosyltransferase involved in cell wall biosynthesis
MTRFKELTRKSLHILRTNGLLSFIKTAVAYIKTFNIRRKYGRPARNMFIDVLFINGCYLPHPQRYRVDHQREQLFAFNIISDKIFYTDVTKDMIKYCRMFVLFRCPHTDELEDFVKEARANNKTVLYDIDDLVIDLKYTNEIKYLDTMESDERAHYDDGVLRMQKMLKLCDGAITSTEVLATELRRYVPEVFVNRNVASDDMLRHSERAVFNRDALPFIGESEAWYGTKAYKKYKKISNKRILADKVRIGFFSGSITHNADIGLILPALQAIMEKHADVELHFVGELDIPEELKDFQNRIVPKPFVNWTRLPELIASVDINISPLECNIFNAAKSENKWIEAALVKVPTVASRIGAFEQMIVDGETGFLCTTNDEWIDTLDRLIGNKALRDKTAQNAFDFVKTKCATLYTGGPLAKYLREKMKPNIAFVLPSLHMSGGVLVALKHCALLKKVGFDVLIINNSYGRTNIQKDGDELYVISSNECGFHGRFDKAVATLWTTTSFFISHPNIAERYYLVQNFETNFYLPGNYSRFAVQQTYSSLIPLKYITISKWCESWLAGEFGQCVKYAPNGLDIHRFSPQKRTFEKATKVRILVEGNSNDYYKNVDESFRIVEKLDKRRFEIWYMSYEGRPKKWYWVDRFFHKVPYDDVPQIYAQCHILLKSSILESFSYPPLEMMASGGYVVVAPNDGNIEYLENRKNCLLYEQGNSDSAVKAIEEICSDAALREILYTNGVETAKNRDWKKIKDDIMRLYDVY